MSWRQFHAYLDRFPLASPSEEADGPDCDGPLGGEKCWVTSDGWEPDALTAHVRF